jgi:predicted TIM-barrel fold metal-dependent hydrolase
MNPEIEDHADNTRRYVENSPLNDAARARVFAENAKRVYPRAAHWITAQADRLSQR